MLRWVAEDVHMDWSLGMNPQLVQNSVRSEVVEHC